MAADRLADWTDLIGALPTHPTKTYRSRPVDIIRYLAVHHAASSETATPEQIARYHVSRGWPGIGYHFLIDPAGTVYRCWPATTMTYCVAGSNMASLCICLLGDRDQRPIPEAQRAALVRLLRQCMSDYRVPVERVLGHREFPRAATVCPGRYVDMDAIRAEVSHELG